MTNRRYAGESRRRIIRYLFTDFQKSFYHDVRPGIAYPLSIHTIIFLVYQAIQKANCSMYFYVQGDCLRSNAKFCVFELKIESLTNFICVLIKVQQFLASGF